MSWAPDYVDLAAMKSYLRIEEEDDTDDAEIAVAITAASRAVDECCNRQFGSVASPEERTYWPWWNRRRCRWIIPVDDLVAVTGVGITLVSGTIDDYDLEPRNAVQEGMAYTQVVVGPDSSVQPCSENDEVTMLAPWGWPAFPSAIVLGTKLQASRFFKRRDAPFGISDAMNENAVSQMRLLARVDPDVRVSLSRYVRPRRVG